MRIVDLQLNIDGCKLDEGGAIEDLIQQIENIIDSDYPITYTILYEEEY